MLGIDRVTNQRTRELLVDYGCRLLVQQYFQQEQNQCLVFHIFKLFSRFFLLFSLVFGASRLGYIEDITWPREDTKFLFSC